jgi:hypothetical protein
MNDLDIIRQCSHQDLPFELEVCANGETFVAIPDSADLYGIDGDGPGMFATVFFDDDDEEEEGVDIMFRWDTETQRFVNDEDGERWTLRVIV